MSSSSTRTWTWTITQARYVTSKIATDLELLREHYGKPSEEKISDFAEEAALLLAIRCLKSVEYGFKKDGKIVFALKYVARNDGTLTADDRPGRIPASLDLESCRFYTFLTYSDSFYDLSKEDRDNIEECLPVRRTDGNSPVLGSGSWTQNRTYSTNGEGVFREIFKPYE